MTEPDVDDIKARLDYIEAAMEVTWTSGYLSYEEFIRKMPTGPPTEVMEFMAAGK